MHDVQLVLDISIIFIFSSAMHLSPMMFNSSLEDVPNIYVIFIFSSAMHLSPMMFNSSLEDVCMMFNSSPIFL